MSLFQLIGFLILGERVLTLSIKSDFSHRQSLVLINAMAEKLCHTVLGQMVAQPSLHVIWGKNSPCRLNSRISKATFSWKWPVFTLLKFSWKTSMICFKLYIWHFKIACCLQLQGWRIISKTWTELIRIQTSNQQACPSPDYTIPTYEIHRMCSHELTLIPLRSSWTLLATSHTLLLFIINYLSNSISGR